MRITAVVVTYNRAELLNEVVLGLLGQTRKLDRIIVVDNGSTDGSREYLRQQAKAGRIIAIESADNGGGAGGFARGMAWALEDGAEYVWLMDDDAIPEPDCLEILLGSVAMFPEASFVCPQVIDADGATGPRNYPILSRNFKETYAAAEQGLLAISAATFVGPLISARAAAQTHLPLEDFFIWHDDMEYTSRIRGFGPAFAVPLAKIKHLATNPGPSHYNAGRNFYNLRNYIWWAREARETSEFGTRTILIALFRTFRIQFKNAPNKFAFLGVAWKGTMSGMTKRPTRRSAAETKSRSLALDQVFGAS